MSIQDLTFGQLDEAVRKKVKINVCEEYSLYYPMEEVVAELKRRSVIDLNTETTNRAIEKQIDHIEYRTLHFGPEFNEDKVLFHLERALKASQKKEPERS